MRQMVNMILTNLEPTRLCLEFKDWDLVWHHPRKLDICLFDLMLNVPVNSFSHVWMVSSPNHSFSWVILTKRLTSTSCTYFACN